MDDASPPLRAGQSPPTFAEVEAFLASGAPWPVQARPDRIETHSSLVFLTRDRAWKLKKPVRLIHVDQTPLAARERFCREEVRLNRQLSGNLYRGVRRLVQTADGALELGGEGRTVDWLIEMGRLPAAEMLDRRLANGPRPTTEEIAAVINVLARFYRDRDRLVDSGEVFLTRLLQDSQVAVNHLREMAPTAGLRVMDAVLDFARPAISRSRNEILDRAKAGLLVDGHGDLRAEHVCLIQPPVIFDRLETEAELRIVDPYFELGALGIECGLFGEDWIGPQLCSGLDPAFPPPSPRLMATYGIVACMTRARFAIDHFRDDGLQDPWKWRDRVEDYLRAAARLVERARCG